MKVYSVYTYCSVGEDGIEVFDDKDEMEHFLQNDVKDVISTLKKDGMNPIIDWTNPVEIYVPEKNVSYVWEKFEGEIHKKSDSKIMGSYKYEKMNWKEFSNFLLTLKEGDSVNFGCKCDKDLMNSDLDFSDIDYWYSATMLSSESRGNNSLYIFVEWLEGDEEFTIPINLDFEESIKTFFENNCFLGSADSFVYVDLELKQ